MTTTDHFKAGLGTLAKDSIDQFPDDAPWTVNGVAIPVNTVVNGGQNVDHFFPPESLQDSAELLEGKPIVKNFHDLDGQANADDVIGEVTSAGFQKGVGLVFEGEITDPDIAQKVKQGYLDVSPTPARSLGEFDESMGAQRVERLADFRDIAIVAQGQPGAEVNMGSNPAVEALSMDVLSDIMAMPEQDTLQRESAREPTFDGTETSEAQPWGDISKDFTDWVNALGFDAETTADLTQEEKETIAAHTLLGDTEADEWGSLLFFPVVNPNNQNLNEGALNAVRGGRGEQADISESAFESAESMAEQLLADNFEGYEMEDGELETMSMDMLETNGDITVNQFREFAQVARNEDDADPEWVATIDGVAQQAANLQSIMESMVEHHAMMHGGDIDPSAKHQDKDTMGEETTPVVNEIPVEETNTDNTITLIE